MERTAWLGLAGLGVALLALGIVAYDHGWLTPPPPQYNERCDPVDPGPYEEAWLYYMTREGNGSQPGDIKAWTIIQSGGGHTGPYGGAILLEGEAAMNITGNPVLPRLMGDVAGGCDTNLWYVDLATLEIKKRAATPGPVPYQVFVWAGVGITAAAVVAFLLWRRRKAAAVTAPPDITGP